MVLKMPFFFFSNIDIKFIELKKLTWTIYTTAQTLSTTNQVKIIDKKKFARVAIDKNFKTFIVHMSVLQVTESLCHTF